MTERVRGDATLSYLKLPARRIPDNDAGRRGARVDRLGGEIVFTQCRLSWWMLRVVHFFSPLVLWMGGKKKERRPFSRSRRVQRGTEGCRGGWKKNEWIRGSLKKKKEEERSTQITLFLWMTMCRNVFPRGDTGPKKLRCLIHLMFKNWHLLKYSETVDYIILSLNALGSSSFTETEVRLCAETSFTVGVTLRSPRWRARTRRCADLIGDAPISKMFQVLLFTRSLHSHWGDVCVCVGSLLDVSPLPCSKPYVKNTPSSPHSLNPSPPTNFPVLKKKIPRLI